MDGNGNGRGYAPVLERSIKEPLHVAVPGGTLMQRPGESEEALGRRADLVRRQARESDGKPAVESHVVRFLRCFDAVAT